MAVGWKNVLLTLGMVGLFFVGIPIRIDKKDSLKSKLLFKEFVQKYNKSYSNNKTEYDLRFSIFQNSIEMIDKLNSGKTSNYSATYGLTKYSDMSPEEFKHRHLLPGLHEKLMKSRHWQNKSKINHKHSKRAIEDLPQKIDWREKKVITPVRNQQTCGACWAFSIIETAEAMYALKKGVLKSFSVQEMIDCARNGNKGCDGGDACSLMEWLTDNKISIEPETDYPLKWQTGTCKLKGSEVGIHIAPNFTCEYLVGNENGLLALLANHGPVTVAINAMNWQYYLGGVIQFHCDGALPHMNHAVQVVGYDRTADIPHYIIRNSWGVEFGDKGYLYIAIGNNICGIGTEVSSLDIA